MSSWFTNAHSYGYSNSYSDVHAYTHGYGYLYADTDGDSNVHAYTDGDCYSGNPDSDANMHTGRDLVRDFERFWHSGG